MPWMFLILAGIAEVAFAICLKLSNQFTRPIPTVLFILFAAISFFLMTYAMKAIPMGTVYAVWTGIGAAGTIILSSLFFNEPLSISRGIFLLLLLVSIIGLKLSK